MIRRYTYFERNVVPTLLYTLDENISNRLEGEILYKSGDFTYRYQPEWAKFPDELWGYVISGVAADRDDHIYVTLKCKDAPIAKFDRDGRLLCTFGEKLPFAKLHGISVAEDQTIWVTDDTNHVAFHVDQQGKLLLTIGTLGVPSDSGYRADFVDPEDHSKPLIVKVFDDQGNEIEKVISQSAYKSIKRMAPPFNKPTKIISCADGLFASDGYGNTAIHAFDTDGNLLRSWGSPGTAPGAFSIVHSLWIDKMKRIWACDRENDRVQVFTMNGKLLQVLDGLWYPVDVWDDGTFVYILQNDGCVSIFDMQYQLKAEIGHWRSANLTAHAITGDSRGNLYLADCGVKGVVRLERV